MPVLLVYLTAMVDDQGQVLFREDIYQRDAPVFEALDQPSRTSSFVQGDQTSG